MAEITTGTEVIGDEGALRMMYLAAPISIVSIGADGRIRHANPAFRDYLGYRQSELVGMHFLELTHPDDRGMGAQIFAEITDGKEDSYSYEKRYLRKDGTRVWGKLSVAPVRDGSGRFLRAIAMINDITDQKETLANQAGILSLLEATLEATEEGLLVVDLDGKILASNQRFAELWNMPAELIAERDDSKLLEFAGRQLVDPDQFIRGVQSVYANRDLVSLQVLEFKNGKILERSSRPHRAFGATTGLVWSFRDITGQKKAETATIEALAKAQVARAEAEAERNRAEILSEASRVLAGSLDFATTIRAILGLNVPAVGDWSAIGVGDAESGMKLIGFRGGPEFGDVSEQIEQNTILDSEAPEGIPRVIRSGKAVLYAEVTDADLTVAEGRWPVVGTRDPLTLAAVKKIGLRSFMIVPLAVRGKVIGAISIGSSSAKRRYTADDLRLAEEIGRRSAISLDSAILYRDALRTIEVREDFLSIASHELRTPLSPLRMQFEMAHLFAKEIPDTYPKRSELLEMMEGAGRQMDRLLRLVDNLLDVSRITAGRLKVHGEWMDLVKLVEEIAKRFAPSFEKAGCLFRWNAPSSLVGFWDPSRVDQVISNLFSNALKYGAGKPIAITLEYRNGEAHISVRDEGVGIAPENFGKIFERFERADSPAGIHGFGLGLYISREIIAAHSGKIEVESAPGHGSRFTVRLPIRNR
jgi:PAS domain S-box-containing protein